MTRDEMQEAATYFRAHHQSILDGGRRDERHWSRIGDLFAHLASLLPDAEGAGSATTCTYEDCDQAGDVEMPNAECFCRYHAAVSLLIGLPIEERRCAAGESGATAQCERERDEAVARAEKAEADRDYFRDTFNSLGHETTDLRAQLRRVDELVEIWALEEAKAFTERMDCLDVTADEFDVKLGQLLSSMRLKGYAEGEAEQLKRKPAPQEQPQLAGRAGAKTAWDYEELEGAAQHLSSEYGADIAIARSHLHEAFAVGHAAGRASRDAEEQSSKRVEPALVDGIPRRIRVDKLTLLEAYVRRAETTIEVAGAHELLTKAQMLVNKGRTLLADWVDIGSPGAFTGVHSDWCDCFDCCYSSSRALRDADASRIRELEASRDADVERARREGWNDAIERAAKLCESEARACFGHAESFRKTSPRERTSVYGAHEMAGNQSNACAHYIRALTRAAGRSE